MNIKDKKLKALEELGIKPEKKKRISKEKKECLEIRSHLDVKIDPISFSDSYEDKLKERLWDDNFNSIDKNIEYESVFVDDINSKHKKTNDVWDVKIGDKIYYFDPTLSYEITGYRPLSMTDGLDFNQKLFTEAGDRYNRTKEYTAYGEGRKMYKDFWDEEYNRSNNGYTVGKYRVTGDHYFFLNYYRMKVVVEASKAGAGSPESFPYFLAKQYEFFHYVELCEYTGHDVLVLKARGVGWSEIAASLGVRPYTTIRNYTCVYTAYTKLFIDKLLDKCWFQLDWLNSHTKRGMKHLRQKHNSAYKKKASKVDIEGTESGWLSEIVGIIADDSNKIRGDRVDRLFFEEFGSNPHSRTSWNKAEPLVIVNGIRKGIRIGWGTGGDKGPALAGLSEMFSDPEAFDILPYKHNYSDDGKSLYTGFFMPSQSLLLKNGCTDDRGVTDEVKAKEYYLKERAKKEGVSLLEISAEHCFTPSEALLRQGENMFDAIAIADRLTQIRILKQGLKPTKASLLWANSVMPDNPRLEKEPIKIIPDSKSKLEIYEMPERDEEGFVQPGLYIAGIDSIDQGANDSVTTKDVSDFCIVIKKRYNGLNAPKYVAMYKDRPGEIRVAYDTALKLLALYNCQALIEYTKISLVNYFKSKKQVRFLMNRPESATAKSKRSKTNLIGIPATESLIFHGLELINNFVSDFCGEIDIDEMLEQLLKYSYVDKRKFDIIAAMQMTEIADEEMAGIRIPKKISNNSWQEVGYYRDEDGHKRFGVIKK